MNKLSNDEKTSRYKKRKILLALMVIFWIATLVLAILSMVIHISPVFAIIAYLIEAILSKYREKLSFRDK